MIKKSGEKERKKKQQDNTRISELGTSEKTYNLVENSLESKRNFDVGQQNQYENIVAQTLTHTRKKRQHLGEVSVGS